MSPAAVLAVYREVFRCEAPDAYLLAIRGASFELGEPMSAAAERHLEAALELAVRLLGRWGQVLPSDVGVRSCLLQAHPPAKGKT